MPFYLIILRTYIYNPQDVENIKQLLSLTPEESKILEDIVEGMVFDETTAPDKPKILKGGELNKIVSWSTSHAFLDVELIACLLMTHHSYTTSIELLDQLVKRYSITPPYGLNQRMFDIYVKRKIVPVRLRYKCGGRKRGKELTKLFSKGCQCIEKLDRELL